MSDKAILAELLVGAPEADHVRFTVDELFTGPSGTILLLGESEAMTGGERHRFRGNGLEAVAVREAGKAMEYLSESWGVWSLGDYDGSVITNFERRPDSPTTLVTVNISGAADRFLCEMRPDQVSGFARQLRALVELAEPIDTGGVLGGQSIWDESSES